MNDVKIEITKDTASPALQEKIKAMSMARVQRAVGTACTILTKNHLNAMPTNKMGWPTTGFYGKAARGTSWNPTSEGVVISIDTPDAPGAMRQRYHGGTITAKDHLLTIPARPEFYGQRASSFTNLKFVMFRSGAKALVIGTGGAGKVNFATGNESNVKGAGARTAAMVAFWLCDSVTQDADPDVIPSPEEYIETAKAACLRLFDTPQNN